MSARIDTWRCRGAAALLATVLALAPTSGFAAGGKPGSYCPFPAAGERPQCLDGAEQRYSAFYKGVESGEMDPADAKRIEADLAAGGEVERTYEALSSLAYGYYVLARRAAQSSKADPVLVARLERWNELLSKAYRESQPEGDLRKAVRAAAQDLHDRAAPVQVTCNDAEGRPTPCTTTEALLHGMDDARDHTGVRGQLGRLMERVFGGDKN